MTSESAPKTERNDGHTIARNTAYNLLGRGLPLLVGLATMPFGVRYLGEERFGLFAIGMTIITMSFMFDLGLGRAVAKYVAAYRAEGRAQDIPPLLWSALLIQALLGTLGALVFGACTPWLVESVLTIPEELLPEARNIFYLLAAAAVLTLTESGFAGALEGCQRFGLLNAVRAPANVLGLLFILWVAYIHGPLTLFFTFFLGTRVAVNLLLLLLCSRIIPGLFRNGKPSVAGISPLIHFGKWVTLSNLIAPALLYADRLLVASMGSLGQVAYYTGPFQLAERILIIPSTLTSTLFPAISALDSTNARLNIQRLSAQALHYLVCIMGLTCVALAIGAPWIVWVFFGEAYMNHSVSVLRILLSGLAINALALVPFSVVQACGRPDITAKLHLVEFPIHIIMVVVGYHVAGLPGVALAWTLRVCLDCLLLLAVCDQKSWLRFGRLVEMGTLRNVSVYAAIGAVFSLVTWKADEVQIAWAIGGVVLLIVYTGSMGLTAEERRKLWRLLRRRGGVPAE